MSNALRNVALSGAKWRTSSSFYGCLNFRPFSCTTVFNSNTGEVVKSTSIEGSDSLHDDFNNASSTTNILRLVHEHHRNMNEVHSVQALKTIFNLQKEGRSNLSTQNLLKHPDFEKICANIKRYSGVIKVNDAINSLKVLNYVGVPSDSTITQVLWQIIRDNVNSLSIPHILFLDFLLCNLQKTPLIEAMKIALPLVFQIHIRTKMSDSDPEHMVQCLQYAQKYKLPLDCVDFILTQLEKFPGGFEGTVAGRIIFAICQLPRNEKYKALLNKATTDLIVNIDAIPVIEMEVLLNKLAHRYTRSHSYYYQDVFFDTCANYIIDHNAGYKRALGVLRNMARMHHVHKPLIDYISTYIYENPMTEKDPADIYSIVVALILSDYRPTDWSFLKEWIQSSQNLATENRREIIWLRFAAALCALDIFDVDVLKRTLNESYLHHLLIEKEFFSNYENYFLIWQCIKTYRPDLIKLFPKDLSPTDLKEKAFPPKEFPLKGALCSGLGGDQFILTNLFSKLGIQIDHAVIISNGSPVRFETTVEYVEDIKLENDSQQLVLFWLGTQHHYTKNTNVLRGAVLKTLGILEDTLKCNVIPISLQVWNELNDFEKIPYLIQNLKEKLNLNINVLECNKVK